MLILSYNSRYYLDHEAGYKMMWLLLAWTTTLSTNRLQACGFARRLCETMLLMRVSEELLSLHQQSVQNSTRPINALVSIIGAFAEAESYNDALQLAKSFKIHSSPYQSFQVQDFTLRTIKLRTFKL